MFCHMEEFLPRIAKNEESLMEEIKKDRSLIDGLRNKYIGTERENKDLLCVYQLVSAYRDKK